MFICNKMKNGKEISMSTNFLFFQSLNRSRAVERLVKTEIHTQKYMSFSPLFIYVLHLLYQKRNFSNNSLRSFRRSNTQCDEKDKKTIVPFFGYYHCKKTQTYFLPL